MARVMTGQVVATKMDKTAVVAVARLKEHRLYGKKYKVTKKYLVHDSQNSAKVGQRVTIFATRPLSRRKRWQIRATQSTSKENKDARTSK